MICSVRKQTETEKRKAVLKLFMGMITATIKRNQVLAAFLRTLHGVMIVSLICCIAQTGDQSAR